MVIICMIENIYWNIYVLGVADASIDALPSQAQDTVFVDHWDILFKLDIYLDTS